MTMTIWNTRHQLQVERNDRLAREKTLLETELRLLQAQIEPHFSPVNEHEELLRIQAAQQRVHAETQMLREEYAQHDQSFALLSEEMRKYET